MFYLPKVLYIFLPQYYLLSLNVGIFVNGVFIFTTAIFFHTAFGDMMLLGKTFLHLTILSLLLRGY